MPKNESETIPAESLYRMYEVPGEISEILERSCNDCHSNKTHYLWYHKFAPMSWGVWAHIKEGKKNLNFDKWGKYNNYQKHTIYDNLHEVWEKRNMPLISYTAFHEEARLTGDEIQLLRNWFEKLEETELKKP